MAGGGEKKKGTEKVGKTGAPESEKPRANPDTSTELQLLALRAQTQKAEKKEKKEKSLSEHLDRLFREDPKIKPPEDPEFQRVMNYWVAKYSKSVKLCLNKYRSGTKPPLHEVDMLAGWMRLKANDGKELKLVYEQCKRQSVPFELVFVALAESHWNPSLNPSSAGAHGYWQFIPGTARDMGLQVGNGVDEREDVRKSTRAGVRYLRQMYDQTYRWDKRIRGASKATNDDRWAYAMWSYNRGPGNVGYHYRKFHGDAVPYTEAIGKVSEENQEYVPRIFAIREVLRRLENGEELQQPQDVVIPDEPVEEISEESIVAAADTAESAIAPVEKGGTLQDDESLEAAIAAEVAVLEGGSSAAASEVGAAAKIAHADRVSPKPVAKAPAKSAKPVEHKEKKRPMETAIYTVRAGDNIHTIALRLTGDSKKEKYVRKLLRDLNPRIENLNLIRVGQKIKVPAREIVVPKGATITGLAKKYYPRVSLDEAIVNLSILNGRDLATINHLEVDDKLLVPVVL